MSMDDRDWNRHEPSGAGRFFGRVFENVENPMGWSIKFFTFRGITTRAHVLFVFMLVAQPLFSINDAVAGFWWMAFTMISLFGIVLLHEFGHCFACRWVGGSADRIVLLPWGGLALCLPPSDWKSNLITTIGGPLVNVALVPVTAGLMIALGQSDALLFHPLNPWGSFTGGASSTAMYWVQAGAFALHFINVYLLAFNVLVPCFPLDGGRIVQALLWKKYGYRRSMEIATLIGFAGSGVMLVIGLATSSVFLAVIGGFCGFYCFMERKRVRSEIEITGVASPTVFSPDGVVHQPAARDRGPSKREQKAEEKREQEEERLDELLHKISEHGMHALTKRERATLDRLSKQRRDG